MISSVRTTNKATTIAYMLSPATTVKLSVFDMLGREIVWLVESPQLTRAYSKGLLVPFQFKKRILCMQG